MASENRKGGKISFKINGIIRDAKGNFTYNMGYDKNTAIVGADKPHGYSAVPQVAFIEGAITDSRGLKLSDIMEVEEETVTLELANGKTILLPSAWFAAEGDVDTEEGEIGVRFESRQQAKEV